MIDMRPPKTVTGLLLGLAALCQPLLAAGQEAPHRPFDHAGLARQALERHIVPGYARLAEAATTLSQTLDRDCARPSSRRPRAIDAAFGDLIVAWGRVEHVNFGPVTAGNRLERILFFPDRRGLGTRQIARVLKDHDPAVTDASALAGRSVALQGLGALDETLYGLPPSAPSTAQQRTHRCAYARAIAANVAGLAGAIVNEWSAADGYRHDWLNAGTGSRVFVKPSETTLALAKAFNQGIERVRDERLGAALGLSRQRRKMPAVLAKSGLSLVLVKANLDGLLELYEIGGMHRAIAPPGVPEDREGIAAKARLVAAELASARDVVAASARVPSPFDNAAVSRRLIAVGFPLKNAREIAHEVLVLTANLTLGFNSSDGD